MGLRIERFGCFGKLPVSREFLVDQARDLSDSRLDRWIGEGLGMAKALLGPRFDEQVTSFPPYWFVWGGGSGARLVAGQLRPSEDAAGRKHPFLIFGYSDSRRAGGLAAAGPSALSGMSYSFESLFTRAAAAASPAELLDLIRNEPGPAESDGRAAYEAFVNATTGADFWRDRLGAADAPLRFQVMQAFVETVGPLKARNTRDVRLGIRFPVTGAHAVSFWLEMTARRLGRSVERASWFWCAPSAGSGDLYLFFSEPSGAQWTCLVDRDANIETMSCLDRPYGSDPERRMDSALRSLLDTPAATLADYLQWAGRSVS